jgi:hypothetical protein
MKKQITKKLQSSRKSVSRLWQKYRLQKKKIQAKKTLPSDIKRGLIAEQREITKNNISDLWLNYREYKQSYFNLSKYENFSLVKTLTGNYRTNAETGKKKYFKFNNTFQEFYKAQRGYDEYYLNEDVQSILGKPGVIGVLVTIKILDEETGLIHYVSDFVNAPKLARMEGSLYDSVIQKAQAKKSMQEFELKGIYLRVIYENSKNSAS